MAYAACECVFAGAMVDGQFDGDFGDAYGAHHAFAGVEQALVFLVFGGEGVAFVGGFAAAAFAGEGVMGFADYALAGLGEPLVVGAGGGECFFGFGVGPAGHGLGGGVGHVVGLALFGGAHGEWGADDECGDGDEQDGEDAEEVGSAGFAAFGLAFGVGAEDVFPGGEGGGRFRGWG